MVSFKSRDGSRSRSNPKVGDRFSTINHMTPRTGKTIKSEKLSAVAIKSESKQPKSFPQYEASSI